MNNYQKTMKEIRLSDAQKEEILQNILAQDIQPVKKRVSWFKPSLALVMVVILAVLIMPKSLSKGAAVNNFSGSAAPAEAAPGDGVIAEPKAAPEEAMRDETMSQEISFTANGFMAAEAEAEFTETEISGIVVQVDTENKIARFAIDDTEYNFAYDTDDEEEFTEELQKFIESIKGKEHE